MDMMTLTMAEAYTDEKVAGGGGGGNAPVALTVLNLKDFSGSDGVSISDVILGLFLNSGGQTDVANASGFWSELHTNVPNFANLMVNIDASEMGVSVLAKPTNLVYGSGGIILSVELSFTIFFDVWMEVTVVFLNEMDKLGTGNTKIVVVVEPLNVPGV